MERRHYHPTDEISTGVAKPAPHIGRGLGPVPPVSDVVVVAGVVTVHTEQLEIPQPIRATLGKGRRVMDVEHFPLASLDPTVLAGVVIALFHSLFAGVPIRRIATVVGPLFVIPNVNSVSIGRHRRDCITCFISYKR